MLNQRFTKKSKLLLQVSVFVAFLLLWWGLTASGVVKPLFLPSPRDVVVAFWNANTCQQLESGRPTCGAQNYFLWQHVLASLQRIGIGVGLALVAGVLVGYLMGTVEWIYVAVEPYINFLRALPPLGYIGLLIVWFGIGDTSKIWLLFLAAFSPIVLGTISGVRNTQQDRILAAYTLGANPLSMLWKVIVPSSLPDVLSGIRLAVGFAWTTVVAAEINNGIPGIGGLAYVSGTQLNTALTIACIIVIGIAALLLDAFLKWASKVLVPWQGRA
ncbi:ABC transporter permease [Corynebacterium vitaeruminis]|uniref:ABC transporter permease n=1 Tax=Corynebacterium vitaeruminis TaxID=38305 RepID=UPI0023F21C0A|nr:ABC transporter permease [Corynebacterium vitaeruminis]